MMILMQEVKEEEGVIVGGRKSGFYYQHALLAFKLTKDRFSLFEDAPQNRVKKTLLCCTNLRFASYMKHVYMLYSFIVNVGLWIDNINARWCLVTNQVKIRPIFIE